MFSWLNRLIVAVALVVGFSSNAFAESWFVTANGGVGTSPVWVGTEGGKTVYVCRIGGTPGKLIASDGKCYIGYYGKEYAYTSYEVLQDPSGRYRFFGGSALSDEYVIDGGYENGVLTQICRVRRGNDFIGGKLIGPVQNGKCYYGYYGVEYLSTVYDALSDA